MSRALTEEQLLVWKDRIVRQAASGVSIADFCRQESVAEAKFYYWKRKLYGAARGAALEVKPKSASSNGLVERSAPFVQVPLQESRGASWIEIVAADGTQIRLPQQNLDAFELALAALSGRSARAR